MASFPIFSQSIWTLDNGQPRVLWATMNINQQWTSLRRTPRTTIRISIIIWMATRICNTTISAIIITIIINSRLATPIQAPIWPIRSQIATIISIMRPLPLQLRLPRRPRHLCPQVRLRPRPHNAPHIISFNYKTNSTPIRLKPTTTSHLRVVTTCYRQINCSPRLTPSMLNQVRKRFDAFILCVN